LCLFTFCARAEQIWWIGTMKPENDQINSV
jgi:hypothetical protein